MSLLPGSCVAALTGALALLPGADGVVAEEAMLLLDEVVEEDEGCNAEVLLNVLGRVFRGSFSRLPKKGDCRATGRSPIKTPS
ncbi:hypothetical protein GCM10007320_25500 [Pseudorhodoferax aquiterrae]|uniref:Uncharacterized protein n=1 Tax=Pseudorhodoferax aquiterrae TaxID=747304 RepID=A0ABQ3G146_9BURK|nr:hypothetical protein GCM10007320_25500 [Pseudorhodoferax aquiterrae]